MYASAILIFVCMALKNKHAYWWCQIGGWFSYATVILFFTRTFNQEINKLVITRLSLNIVLGFICTHILRLIIKKYDLLPPIKGKMWLKISLAIIGTCVLYSISNSVIVELFHWYNPDPKIKATVSKRFILNLIDLSPILLIWVCIYYVWHYVLTNRKNEIDRIRLESLVKELELKTIKSHINPHFIFNALNSIRALVDENPQRARNAITELSNILRSSMQAEKVETTTVEKELSIVEDYLALESIRFEDRLRVSFDIDEDTKDQPVPPMMLQTLVENAIKHGISKRIDGGEIRIISDFVDNHHELVVQNTGQLEGEINAEGFGITSTYNRLNLLFGKKASFKLKNIEGMVEAKIIMPV